MTFNFEDIIPEKLAQVAQSMEKLSSKLKVTIFDKKRIQKEKMGLLLTVNRSTDLEPRFIVLSYRGNPSSKKSFALVGKGVTYDTGGLSLKSTSNMEEMKCDMGGAATVLGTVYSAVLLGLKVNLWGVIPATENGIGSRSYKPGDVYSGHSGKTVEITNTDAEGRLILADAISYTIEKLKPDYMITLATLTGGIVVALGDEIAGYFSDHEKLSQGLEKAAKESDELVWRMPLHANYLDFLKSEIADIKNCDGREASSIQAALFLKEFVDKTPWVHMDIAGTAFRKKAKSFYPSQATGYGVRMLLSLLESFPL